MIVFMDDSGGGGAPSTLLTGLHEWWEFAETTGNRVGSHASTPAVPSSGAVARAAGRVTWAVDVSAAHCSVTEASAPWIELAGHTAVTWAYWLWAYSWNSNAGTFGRWGSGNSYVSWLTTTSPYNRLEWGHGGGLGALRTGLATGAWIHVVQSYDPVADLYAAYINNDGGVTRAWAGPFAASSSNLHLGRYTTSGGAAFNGKLSEFACWNRVLTGAERTELYNGGAGIAYSSL